ncbi:MULTISPECIES: FtsK/SpoIIIE domain-containing protein [unclassified Streptomyces]|uniref:FtsK/SpoIIIE domain-containing protein n=1 Tax=unclassified Streptomyces TaxID=2593676 RepID=UPI00136C567C|nr:MULTISPECIES: FtsK/SpoIIIE domain-containing protein [unclassified Streptomyces]NDZ98746.1 ATP-binding protein [Streptomyces sp. SID10116]MYY83392.1 ATP-binding protein [Streptomyces sp. SID335]MYZ15730.1 ATP-binding protein [Streptomyces sp. SID337]NDZ84770.1 ATP-binding protein [Streptomyces sp. SID10115]NEB43037.1 ATP-binding protein [Streptomyces sp. SID339]
MDGNVVPLHKTRPAPVSEPGPTLTVVPEPSPTPAVPLWVRSGRAIQRAVTHERTREVGRLAVRHSMYVVGGTRIVTRRAWDGRTGARYERLLRAAEAQGNYEVAAEWEERLQRFREARHRRRMDLLKSPVDVAKGLAVGTGAGIGALVGLGVVLAIGNEDVTDVLTPLMAVVEFIRLLITIVSVVWGPALRVGPLLALLALWSVGRHSQAAPNWALPANVQSGEGEPITPSIVVKALRDLGVPALRNAIKEMGDAGAAMLGPIRIAGCGVEVDVTLPSGVSTVEVQQRRRKLAENLTRHEHEVFITIPEAARTVRLWVADSGALDEPIGPSPLVTDETMTADYAKGRAPWGQDLRGDAAALSLYQRHLLITGLSNQGKTVALRSLALWLALDKSVQFLMGDLKGVGDWAMFDGLANTLIQGPTDEHVIEVTEMVEGAVEEMNRRIQAPPGTAFPPLIVLVDEAQVAFMCPAKDDQKRPYGGSKANSRYFMAVRKIHNQGRAVNVLMWQGTQDPTNENLPKLVREGAHTRASLALGTESQARMALGDKAVDGGAAPNLLRPGLDRGTLVVASDGIAIPQGQSSITVRTHYIDDDNAKAITERAKALRDGVTTLHAIDRSEQRDPLTDILSVLGDAPRVLTQTVLQRLAALSKDAYGTWSFGDLKRVLENAGADPYKSDGRMVVGRDRVARALANRPDDEGPDASISHVD